MTKKLLAACLIISLALGISLKTCSDKKYKKEVQYWADYAPHGITIEDNLVFRPHCDWFSCGGGTIYRLAPQTADAISKDGMSFFKTLPSPYKGKNGRSLGDWKKLPPISLQIEERAEIMKVVKPHYWNGDGANHPASKRLGAAIDNHSYYVSNRGAEPKIIISPEAKLIYIGWFD